MNYRIEFSDVADMEMQNIILWQIGRNPYSVEQWQEKFQRAINSLT